MSGTAGLADMRRGSKELPDGSIKEGYLKKRAVKSGRNWKKRWFVLNIRERKLMYYKKKGAKKPLGEFQLCNTSHIDSAYEVSGKDNCFQIQIPSKVCLSPYTCAILNCVARAYIEPCSSSRICTGENGMDQRVE
jgi:hypothetical protein